MSRVAAYVIAILAAVLAGWLVPAVAMRALAPSLQAAPLERENFRRRRVFLGLGIVWAVWAVALFAASAAFEIVGAFGNFAYGTNEMLLFEAFTLPLYAVPIILVLAAVIFGIIDDVFGTGADRGFRGHVSALMKGRLTTGGLKLLGIGLVAAVHAWRTGPQQSLTDGTPAGKLVLWWFVGTLVIALSANLLNLLDLRPGRALKSYGVLAVAAAALFVSSIIERYVELALQAGLDWTGTDTVVLFIALLVVLLGPVFAVWKYDLGEQGMLGDAGSNAMGAIIGFLLVRALPLEWLSGVAVVLLAMNVLSERVSFSSIIERVGLLRYLDGIGRRTDVEGGPPGPEDEEPR